MMPVRYQRTRSGDDAIPIDAKYVGRPTDWGNPFTHLRTATTAEIVVASRRAAVDFYEAMLVGDPNHILGQVLDAPEQTEILRKKSAWILDHLTELRGKDLVCWCPKSLLCHADILLQLANQ